MAELKKRKVILDVDTGSDDAMAMIAAMMSPEFEVIGVCSVNGNREVKLTTLNTLRVMELLESNVPVYRGCEYPMVSTLDRKPMLPYREGDLDGTDIGVIHGDHLPLPGPTWRKEEDLNAKDADVMVADTAVMREVLFAIGELDKNKKIRCL